MKKALIVGGVVGAVILIAVLGLSLYLNYEALGRINELQLTVDGAKSKKEVVKKEESKPAQPEAKKEEPKSAGKPAAIAQDVPLLRATAKFRPEPAFQITVEEDGELNGVIRVNGRKVDPKTFDSDALGAALAKIAEAVNGKVPASQQAEAKANEGAKVDVKAEEVEVLKEAPKEVPVELPRVPKSPRSQPAKQPAVAQPKGRVMTAKQSAREEIRRQIIINPYPFGVPLRPMADFGSPW